MAAYVLAFGAELPVDTKRCVQCHIVKSIDNFYSVLYAPKKICTLCHEKNRFEMSEVAKKTSMYSLKQKKKCTTCDAIKPTNQFYYRSDLGSYSSACRVCIRQREALKKQKIGRPDRTLEKKLRLERKAEGPTSAYYAYAKFNQLKNKSKRLGLPFNLELSDIVIPTHCPVLGIELKINERGNNKSSPSVDRIIPEKGYVKGNIVIVSNHANVIKTNATWQEIRAVADFYEKLGV